MLISYTWLQEYIDGKLPSPEALSEKLTLHSYEVEGIEKARNDYILDIDVLPNRAPDSLSHWGVAREVAALFDLKLSIPEPRAQGKLQKKSSDHISLTVENSALVPRATKRLVEEVSVGESPDWLKERLALFGQRSINNIVDITNLVMLETGQPVHAFDFNKIKSVESKKDKDKRIKEIFIRSAKKAEEITLLDGSEYELEEGMLVIADSKKALDIAGVKGGLASGVDENTKRVMLSVCSFDSVSIRKTSRALNLRTEASKRFENGISEKLPRIAMERLTELIEEVSDGKAAPDVVDLYPRQRAPYKLGVSLERANNILGTSITEDELEHIFSRLSFEKKEVNPREKILSLVDDVVGKPYTYGASVSYDAPERFDCSSLTAYLYAQAGIAIPRISVDQYVFSDPVDDSKIEPGDLIFSNGGNGNIYFESKEYMKGTKIPDGIDHVGVYLGDGNVLHASKETGNVFIEPLDKSTRFKEPRYRGARRVKEIEDARYVITVPHYRLDVRSEIDLIEEIGRMYGYGNIEERLPKLAPGRSQSDEYNLSEKVRDVFVDEGFSEVYLYTFRNKGDIEVKNKIASDKGFLRQNLSDGLREALELNAKNAPLFGTDIIKLFEIGHVFSRASEEVHLCIGVQAVNEKQKKVSEAMEAVLKKLGVAGVEVKDGVAEVRLTAIPGVEEKDTQIIDDSGFRYEDISPYPFVLRDIALWVPKEVESSEVQGVIVSAGSCPEGEAANDEWLWRVDLFDEFAPQAGSGHEKEGWASYAFHLVFQSQEKTLTDEEVNRVMKRIEAAAEKRGWEVR